MIPTAIRRNIDKFEVVEKAFLLLNSPINKIIIMPIEKINSGNNTKSKILFHICNLIIIYNVFNR